VDRRAVRARERGATVVEAALVLPVFLLVVLGLFDFAALLLTQQSASGAVRDGSRAMSIARSDLDADYRLLDQLLRRSAGVGRGELQRVVVYRAENRRSLPTQSCRDGVASSAAPNECNVYPSSTLAALQASQFGCGAGEPDRFFCPSDRRSGDLVGIWVEVRRGSITGLLPTSTMTDYAVLPIEGDPR
jgi:hypothetical protein